VRLTPGDQLSSRNLGRVLRLRRAPSPRLGLRAVAALFGHLFHKRNIGMEVAVDNGMFVRS
jgi:hypothetical protein